MKVEAKAEEHLHGASSKFKAIVQELATTMEGADKVGSDLGFLLKYTKTKDQQELTISMAQQVLGMAA